MNELGRLEKQMRHLEAKRRLEALKKPLNLSKERKRYHFIAFTEVDEDRVFRREAALAGALSELVDAPKRNN